MNDEWEDLTLETLASQINRKQNLVISVPADVQTYKSIIILTM